MKRFFLTLLVCVLLLTGTSIAQEPVTVRIGWGGSPDSQNPGVAVLSEAFTIFSLVYDSMYELNLDGSYSLELAE